jgi:hypothetical protein
MRGVDTIMKIAAPIGNKALLIQSFFAIPGFLLEQRIFNWDRVCRSRFVFSHHGKAEPAPTFAHDRFICASL